MDLERLFLDIESKNGSSNIFLDAIKQYLNPREVIMLKKRAKRLIQYKNFPFQDENRRQYPWPLV